MAARAIRCFALHFGARLFKGTVYLRVCVRIRSTYYADPSLDATLLALFRDLPFYFVLPLTVLCNAGNRD